MISDKLISALNRTMQLAGTQVRIKYYSQCFNEPYDDDTVLTQSGTDVWISGVVLPINQSKGVDNLLLEQGKINNSDKKLYLNGSIIFDNQLQVKIMLGSPGNEYTILDGAITNEVENINIYKKVYIRQLTGSLIGE